MTEVRKLKKSESLEIRIPYPTKQAFMARCQADGRSASEVVRGLIEAEIVARPAKPRWGRLIAGALAAAALGAIAAPSLARPVHMEVSATAFAALDANRDGQLSLAEFTSAPGRSDRP
jgi:hypothetical protein